MITTLGQIRNSVLYRSGKDKRGGFQSVNLFQDAIYFVNERKMNDLVDVFEKNGEVMSDLQPFIKTLGSAQYPALSFTPVLSADVTKGGYATIPTDFWYQARANYTRTVNTACSSTSEYASIALLKQHEFDAVMIDSNDNPVVNPLDNYPIMVIQNNLFYIYPFINRCSFTYIVQPTAPFYDYDIVSGIDVYLPPNSVHQNSSVLPVGTPSRSVEFEYPESCADSVVDMIKTYLAIDNGSQWNIETQIKPKNA